MNRYTQVLRDTSNLLRQEITRPGWMTLNAGSQAHFLQSQGVMDGSCMKKGLLYSLMIKLLQDTLRIQWTMSPATISSSMTENKNMVPILRESILKNFMQATIRQMAMMSLTTQLDPVAQQMIRSRMATESEMMSKSRIFLQTYILLILVLKSQSSSFTAMQTPILPRIDPLMLSIGEKKDQLMQTRIPQTRRIKLRAIMIGQLILMQNPWNDAALLQIEVMVTTKTERMMIRSSPHSNGLYLIEGLQFTIQLKLGKPLMLTVNMLMAYFLSMQLLVTLRRQLLSQVEGDTVPWNAEYFEERVTLDSAGRLVTEIWQLEQSAVGYQYTQRECMWHEHVDQQQN